ncbi:MAG: hypothetical protein Q8761_03180, partial [Sweet potato little leaf phytoplasma]|nr:hypothetical protein [Sweet potato little leaf phytoplasma]
MNEFPDLELNLDPEIERTFHRRRKEQRERNNRMDSSPLLPPGNQPLNPKINQQQGVENRAESPALIADDRGRAIRAYVVPTFNQLYLGIARPEIQAQNFEMK